MAKVGNLYQMLENNWCRPAESNCAHQDFQSYALPTELGRHIFKECGQNSTRAAKGQGKSEATRAPLTLPQPDHIGLGDEVVKALLVPTEGNHQVSDAQGQGRGNLAQPAQKGPPIGHL